MVDPSLLAYVAERTGMRVAGAQQRRLSHVLSRACEESQLAPDTYAQLLRRDQPAFDALADDLTIGETYFFRERPQLELLRQAVQDEKLPARPLRAWSAGCSTGEEAYTLAILLGTVAAPHGVQVAGTDLSPGALYRAEDATYGARSLRSATDAERSRWFTALDRGRVRVRESVRRSVRFSPGNLLDGPPQSAPFDVVLCRNVLIYLSPEAVSRVAEVLLEALLPTGWLLTGVADPILKADGLERVASPEGVLYRRASRSGAPAQPSAPLPPDRRPNAQRLVPPAVDPVPLPPRPLAAAARPSVPSGPPPPPSPGVVGSASVPTSLDAGLAAVENFPTDAGLRYRMAVLHLEAGDLRAAAAAATAAVFLEPALVVGHLLLGRIHESMQDPRAAQRCFRTAASLLDELPGEAPVPHADGETAESLARVVGIALGAPSPSRPGRR